MKTRKILSYILVIALLLCSAGCKKQTDSDPSDSQTASVTGQNVTDTKTTGSTEGTKATETTKATEATQNTEASNTTEATETVSLCNHVPGKWVVDKMSTCTTEGSRHKACTQCKEVLETEVIPMLDHTPGEWIVDKIATCSAEGVQHQSCTQCKTKIITINMVKTAHTPNAAGTKCTVCGAAIQTYG